MGKKGGNGPGGQTSKPTPVPNKEIIQRMNFLHQAATLISGALNTPLPRASPSKLSDNDDTAQGRKKQKKANAKAQKLAESGQLIGTQMQQQHQQHRYGDEDCECQDCLLFPDYEESEHEHEGGSVCSSCNDAGIYYKYTARRTGPTTATIDAQKAAKQEQSYVRYLTQKGLTSAQIQVKLNRRQRRFQRKSAKSTMKPLEVGCASYSAKADGGGAQKNAEPDRPKHPSQVEHRSLAAHYVNDIRTMAKKSVLRIDPSIKRTMCRNCNALLIPGLTSSVKILPSKSHVHLIRTTCLACNVSRAIPSSPLHALPDIHDAAADQSEESSMQEDSARTSVDPSTSRTLSEMSADVIEEASMTIDNSPSAQDASEHVEPNATRMGHKASAGATTKKGKKAKQPRGQRKKRHADPIVPGTKKQYTHPRFHERPEHLVIRVS